MIALHKPKTYLFDLIAEGQRQQVYNTSMFLASYDSCAQA